MEINALMKCATPVKSRDIIALVSLDMLFSHKIHKNCHFPFNSNLFSQAF